MVQLVHDDEGTQRSDEPVSKSIVKFCGGVPMEIVPAHSVSLSMSVSGSPLRAMMCWKNFLRETSVWLFRERPVFLR